MNNYNTNSPKSSYAFCLAIIAAWLLIPLQISAFASDEIPGGPQKQPIAIVGGTVHTATGQTIENGTVLFDAGRITAIGKNIQLPEKTKKVDAKGKHIYPGLFESHSQIGLIEIGAVRATNDRSEVGTYNPNAKAIVSVNPDTEVIPVTRSNGVLLALTAPSGGMISGKSAVIQLDGWTYEDLTLKAESALHVSWPRLAPSSSRRSRRSDSDEDSGVKQLAELKEYFDNARTYHKARTTDPIKQPFDIRLDAMGSVLNGETPIMVSADSIHEIQSAIAFSLEQKVKLIILGGYDAPACADLLNKHQIPVIVSAVYRNPRRADDRYDDAYSLPKRLSERGIKYCISGTDRSETWNARILPDHAATAIAYGLSEDEALKSITLYPAQILGLDKQVGSLEKGKDATLFVADGDIFEITTRVTNAFVQGRNVDLSDRHKRLYKKYKQRYQQDK